MHEINVHYEKSYQCQSCFKIFCSYRFHYPSGATEIYRIIFVYKTCCELSPGILIGGGILELAGVIIIVLSIYSLASLAESMPTNISTKNVIKSALNVNQTAIKESLRSIGITVGLAFSGLLIAIILMVNGIIALIAGTVILFMDRRRNKLNPQSQQVSEPLLVNGRLLIAVVH